VIKTYNELEQKFKKVAPDVDTGFIKKAYEYANLAHDTQKRASGDPYIVHPLNVASILIDFNMYDTAAIAAALLHDTLEDTAVTSKDLEKEFGSKVNELVEGVTNLKSIRLTSDKEEFVENLRKMFLAASNDIRVAIIRLADRTHNMQTLEFLPAHKQERIAKETLEVFAPLAERLGIGEMKGLLEDLSFPYLYPEKYQETLKVATEGFEKLDKSLSEAERKISEILENHKIEYKIQSRKKHIYSLYRKLNRPEISGDITKIYDLLAMRIIVKDVENCYKVLGHVHKAYRPLPGYLKDYIANPKNNGYQSIHTAIFGPGGNIIEVQIRDEFMHEEAEHGVASHWHYSEKKHHSSSQEIDKGFVADERKVEIMRRLSSWQNDVKSNEELLESLKIDLFSERIFVFTPAGDVQDLPVGSTPIDFAYSVHTTIGNNCIGALVNSKQVPLDHKLKSHDVVEIITSKNDKLPNRDWLNFVVTSHARSQIKKLNK